MTVEQLGKMSSRKMEDVDINTLVEVNLSLIHISEPTRH